MRLHVRQRRSKSPVVLPESVLRALGIHRGGRIGLVLAGCVVLAAVVGPILARDPNLVDYTRQLQAPSAAHWLGTDGAGRDLLARSLTGARESLRGALVASAIAAGLGLLIGVLAASIGGWFDTLVSRCIDVLLGLPNLVLTLALVGMLGPGYANLILALALSNTATLARLARSVARSARSRLDVVAARMAGVGPVRIATGHVLPGVTAQVLVAATIGIGEIVLALGALSFLGLGAQPPTAEWGNMLAEARETLSYAPWQLVGPGIGLVATVLAATLISEALRDITEPGEGR